MAAPPRQQPVQAAQPSASPQASKPLQAPQPVRKIGLTGGIGSGKSTVAQMLVAHGAALVDADAESRSVTAAGGAAMPAIVAEFGAEFVDATGAMDRGRMRALVYADATARQRLEAIVHPLVRAQIADRAAQEIAAGRRCIVFDVPLLVESGTQWRDRVDQVLVVDCREETQIARVMQRSGLSREAVEAIIAAQASRAQRLAAADIVIYNDGITLDTLWLEVERVAAAFGLMMQR